ncbi:hypothetical protein TURU_002031 [Turdus rufiventris]|nr:hypothetical protein TURU_002031 [Turdus rufiventris]
MDTDRDRDRDRTPLSRHEAVPRAVAAPCRGHTEHRHWGNEGSEGSGPWCGGTVGAIFTCPLEVIKTRLQSSKLAFRTVYYPQVQLGTISGEGMVRPTSVSPGLLSVLNIGL